MRTLLATAAAGLALFAAAQAAHAQTTDGYHSIQVFPVVVDSPTFTQQFNFVTPNGFPVTVRPRYYPGNGTAQAAIGPLTCPDIVLPANGGAVRGSLRALCPGLTAGSAFGFLHLKALDSSDGMLNDIPVFAGFSRVTNFAGNGFSVEAFAANTFTSATTVITGLKRMAATPSSPTFQTNCFLANMNELDSEGPPVAKRINYTLYAGPTPYPGFVDLLPGQLVRLLDVFAAAGAPAGDYPGAAAVFSAPGNPGDPRPGLMTFCTVQDNSSFGADFRIGKTANGSMGIGSNDGMAARKIVQTKDAQNRPFEIGAGSSANTHVVYFRHPDVIQCRLLDPVTMAPLTAASGLEMRAYEGARSDLDPDEYAGGDNQTSTGILDLGDKKDHGGFNNRYLIEVESNETNAAGVRPYALYCSSGSGNTFGYDIIEYKDAVDRF